MAELGFWHGRRVLVTGHAGFKGTWLCALLLRAGAAVCGVGLPSRKTPNLWQLAPYKSYVEERIADVRNEVGFEAALAGLRPQTIFHLAAQPLVRRGYAEPVETFATNVMGTVHLLEASRHIAELDSIVVVTSDKVYADAPVEGGYTEAARLGGAEPYAASKAACEMVVDAFRSAFYRGRGAARVATARAGNVVGGGDFSEDRLLPDAYRAFVSGAPLRLRNPDAVRPWQHVLDALNGYLRLGEALARRELDGGAFNFGPFERLSAREVAERFMLGIGANPTSSIVVTPSDEPETGVLELDSTRARETLGWKPRWASSAAIDLSAAWYRNFVAGQTVEALIARDIEAYAG